MRESILNRFNSPLTKSALDASGLVIRDEGIHFEQV